MPIATLMGNEGGMPLFEELSSAIRDGQETPLFREEYGEFYLCSRYLDICPHQNTALNSSATGAPSPMIATFSAPG